MSLSNALSNAVSGIVAASRGTEVVASNLANAMTPGFARREVQLSARPWIGGGGGVHIEGVERVVRTAILGQSRTAGAETTRAQTLASFHKGMAEAIGVPGEAGALGTLLASFDAALISAAARPESETALNRVLTTAQALAGGYGTLGDRIQDARTEADRAIADDVRNLNEGLGRVVALNRQIVQQTASGGDVASLEDERQKVIDGLSKIMPIQELPRENGRVALFTSGGGRAPRRLYSGDVRLHARRGLPARHGGGRAARQRSDGGWAGPLAGADAQLLWRSAGREFPDPRCRCPGCPSPRRRRGARPDRTLRRPCDRPDGPPGRWSLHRWRGALHCVQ